MKYFLTLLLVFASVLACSQTKEKPTGNIKGTVSDENGNPASKATVYAIPQEASLDNISPRSTTTNEAGEFNFHGGLALGAHKVYLKKKDEAHPHPPHRVHSPA